MLRQEIKRCWRYYKSTKDIEHLKDIFRLVVYYTKKARAGTRTYKN